MTALGAFLTIAFCIAVFALPRRTAALAMLGAALYITEGQSIELGVNFMAIRFVELSAFLRVCLRGELKLIKFGPVDRWLILYLATAFLFLTLRTGEFSAYHLGNAVDAWLVFFSFRALLTGTDDVQLFLKGAALMLVPFAMFMLYESIYGRNPFAVMGGVREIPWLREGYYRCQGSFRHAITAGSLGATFVPLFLGFLPDTRARWWVIPGVGASLIIVVASHSSGPLMALLAGLGGWVCWVVRRRMRLVRRCVVVGLVGLHLVMSAPVWFIFDRLSGYLGGDGWHRSNLIDQFLDHSGEWWLLGMSFLDTADWAATQLPWGGVDVTNYYVSVGITGGLVPLAFFLTMAYAAFQVFGRTLAALRHSRGDYTRWEFALWGAGCAVFAHFVNLLAVIYWDQSYVIWYAHLAIAVGLSSHLTARMRIEGETGKGATSSTLFSGVATDRDLSRPT